MSSEGKSKGSDKSKAREAFANLVANLWNEERTSYEESYELEEADEIPMEQLEEHNYKDLRVMALYFSPDDSDTDSGKVKKGDEKGKSKDDTDKGKAIDECQKREALHDRCDNLHEHLHSGLTKFSKEQLGILVGVLGKHIDPDCYPKDNLIKLFIGQLVRVEAQGLVLGDQSKDSGKVMGDDKGKSKVDKDKDMGKVHIHDCAECAGSIYGHFP